jgi:hypothetical protein
MHTEFWRGNPLEDQDKTKNKTGFEREMEMT